MNLGIMQGVNNSVNQIQMRKNFNKQNVNFKARSFPFEEFNKSRLANTSQTVDFIMRHFLRPLSDKLTSEIRELSKGKAIMLDRDEERTLHFMNNHQMKSPDEIGRYLLECVNNARPQSVKSALESGGLS